MASQDRRTPPPQPPEDMFGRPTRKEADAPESPPSREAQGAHQLPPSASDAFHRHAEEEAEEEIAYGGVGELPDGDGPRSDLGTNPLPDVYWEAYPDKKPEGQ
jgi:hypothetical protein